MPLLRTFITDSSPSLLMVGREELRPQETGHLGKSCASIPMWMKKNEIKHWSQIVICLRRVDKHEVSRRSYGARAPIRSASLSARFPRNPWSAGAVAQVYI